MRAEPPPHRPAIAAAATAIGLAVLAGACDTGPAGVGAGEVAAIEVAPGAILMTTAGATRQLAATARDADGRPVEGVAFAWSSDDEAVVTIAPSGLASAVASGTTRIGASANGVVGQADVFVRESPAPPLVLHGGAVLTMDPVDRVEEAVVVLGDRIFATGAEADLLALVGPTGVRMDVGGGAVMPGFVDPHNHVYNAVYHGVAADEVGTTYAEAQDRLVRAGTTTMANGNIWPDALADFLSFVDGGGLRVRTSVYLGYNQVCGTPWPDGWYLDHPPIRDPEAMFRIPGIKFFGDGGACNRGAFTFYADGGDLYLTATELADAVARVQAHGYQALIHALGDIAIDSVLAALETVLDGGPNTHRHRMDHNRYLRPHQLPRYSEVGALPVVFGSPFTCRIEDGGDWSFLADDAFAPLRPRLDPWRALLDANPGHPVAWKSDAPTLWPLQPIIHLWSLVTRNEQRADGTVCEAPDWLRAGAITVREALPMMTIHAAHVLLMDDVVGSLTPGKFADLIVLSHDPLAVPAAALRDIQVRMTMIGGTVEFCDAGEEALCGGSDGL